MSNFKWFYIQFQMNRFNYLIFLFVIFFLSCQNSSNQFADLVIKNAKVHTISWDDPSTDGTPAQNAPLKDGRYISDASAIVVSNGIISEVIKDEEVSKYCGPNTRIIDAKGNYVLPGLIESHGHLNEIREKKEAINLKGLSGTKIIDLIVEKAKSKPKGEWIIASGWDEATFANSYPDLNELSSKTLDNPVVLIGLRGFGVMGNALAFRLAGITPSSIPPSGGEVLLDENQQLKFVLLNQAKRLLLEKIPQNSVSQQVRIMNYGFDELLKLGFTTTHHLGVDKLNMDAYQYLNQRDSLPMRVHAFVAARKYNLELVNEWLEKGPTKDDNSFLQVKGFKGYYDGSLGSRGAKFLESYSDKECHTGVGGIEYGFDENLIKKALDKNFQLAIHAIGDKANRDVLDIYDNYFINNPKSKNLRHRIEHVQVVHPDDFSRFAELNITASMEPAHAVEDMPWAIDRIGKDRAKGAYAWRTLRKNEARIIFNSDFTGSDPSFFYGFYCAITKQKKDGNIYYPEQKLTPEETLRAYTIWGAYASHQEKLTGSIEKGKWADFTIVDVDVLNADPKAILKGKVLQTIINGKVKYDAGLLD